ncbi:NADH dehydrogenase (ubiquinone) 1 beta subcomplex, 2, 8kDa [Xylocopa sonorina]|uniref:NADH dehydrogenase (ubiquinone) 1 beta subcomplex, 2, 8kDa n=1 Tax=Xylocopa sonorina TaxID=1818115 RepID=UPI00403B348E
MLLSRSVPLIRDAYHFSRKIQVTLSSKQSSSKVLYRTPPRPPRRDVIMGEITGGIMYWWVLWNFWHESDHITGHFPYPRPIEWSDEYLGIPPDE